MPPLQQPPQNTSKLRRKQVKQMYKDRFPTQWNLIVKEFGDTVLANCYFAQTMLETGQYSSNLYQTQNNLMGMRCVKIRPTTQTGCGISNFGIYSDVASCIKDMSLYYQYFNYPTKFENSEQYVRVLKQKGYFSANEANYLSALNAFMI